MAKRRCFQDLAPALALLSCTGLAGCASGSPQPVSPATPATHGVHAPSLQPVAAPDGARAAAPHAFALQSAAPATHEAAATDDAASTSAESAPDVAVTVKPSEPEVV